jgi:hypothetical protein
MLKVWRDGITVATTLGLFVMFLGGLFASRLSAQQQRTQLPKPPVLPADMDCEKLRGDKEVPTNLSNTILKVGTDYYLCKPKSQTLLARARTAAVAVRSTQTISCGDGSSDDCIKEDVGTETEIEGLANHTDLWRYFDKAPATKADIIIQFVANDRASSSAQIILHVQDSDSGTWPYYESRTITDIENDVNRLVDHFIATSGRTPLRSREEMEKRRQCELAADQLNALQSEYQKKRTEYDFKNAHPLDAEMDECNLHWKEWVCLKRGGSDGGVSYASQWNESVQELQRKLSLEYEELEKLEQQIKILTQSACSSQ